MVATFRVGVVAKGNYTRVSGQTQHPRPNSAGSGVQRATVVVMAAQGSQSQAMVGQRLPGFFTWTRVAPSVAMLWLSHRVQLGTAG